MTVVLFRKKKLSTLLIKYDKLPKRMNFWKIINLKQRRILTQYNSLSHITADVNWWKGHIDYKSSDSNSHKAIFYLLQARRHLAIMPGMYSREKCDKIDTPRMIFWRSKTGKDVLKQEIIGQKWWWSRPVPVPSWL